MQAGIEKYSVARTLRAIDRADIVLLVLDATEIATAQDTHIAGYIQRLAKGIIIIVNKWDLVENKDIAGWSKNIKSHFKFASFAPILYTSAKTGLGVDKVMPEVRHVYQERQKRLPTSAVNSVIQQAVAAHVRPKDRARSSKSSTPPRRMSTRPPSSSLPMMQNWFTSPTGVSWKTDSARPTSLPERR